jgi:asparagine synthase (glutamine-hydrolysing)
LTALAGFWSFDGKPPAQDCERMLQGQALYGIHRAQNDDGMLALGRNLFATLPEDRFDSGPQQRASFRLVADVRLDNRPELATKLGLSPVEQARLCDAALLFEALLAWGAAAVDRLVGEYAFAFWNADEGELLLGRDILGLRPLCFHRGAGFFAFASMPSGLHALAQIPRDLNTDFMVRHLALAPRMGSETFFAGIERVQPAHLLRVTAQGARAYSYWSPPHPVSPSASAQDHAAELRALLDKVVAAQMRGAGGIVATQLSAGLDSSTVTATVAKKHAGSTVMAYTAVPRAGFAGRTPPGTIADEWELAAATARRYRNIEHVRIENRPESPLRWLDRNFAYQQQPMANLTNAVWGQAIHAAARASGSKVIFKASAGNLTISYAGLEWLAQLLTNGQLLKLAQVSLALARGGRSLTSLGADAAGPFIPPIIWRALRKMTGRIEDSLAMSAVSRARAASLKEESKRHGYDGAGRPLGQAFEARLRALRRADGGNAYKGVLGEWGLSVRDPTADRRIIEYCLAVPPEEFVRGGMTRSLARRAFADRLPPEVAGFALRGYQSADWYEAMDLARSEIEQEVAAIARCPEAADALELAWVDGALADWPSDWSGAAIRDRYRLGLLRAASAGHFMRKVKGTN